MSLSSFLAENLARNLNMLRMTVADLTDAEMLVRPVPGANHANWQIGHLINAETGMIEKAGGKVPALPAGFKEKYAKTEAPVDDAAKFLPKDELMRHFEAARNASVAWATSLTDDQVLAPAPENMRKMAPTVGDVIILMGNHTMMHNGQIQVIRRKLGKPILF